MSTYHHRDLRTALLQAAGKRMEKQGITALSLREAARRVGVSHNAPYRHFADREALLAALDRKSTRLNSSHSQISYAVFCLKKKKNKHKPHPSNQNTLT